jgi:hypothetical protein
MRFITKRALVALVAVLALSVASAASASAALPEFGGSTFPVKYSFASNQKVTFSATDAGAYVICTGGGTAEGEITGAKALTARFDFKGCYYALTVGGEMACTTKGASVGEIKSESLKGSLVYISKANKEVGIVFNPYEQAKELKEIVPPPTFATFVCAESGGPQYGIAIRNGVTVPVTSLNTLTKSYALKFAVSENKQVPAEYENAAGEKVRNLLETDIREEGFATGGMETAGTLNLQKSIEVKG